MSGTTNTELSSEIQEIGKTLEVHLAYHKATNTKLDKLYETVVTGNGKEPLTTTVSRNVEFIGTIRKISWIVISAIVVMLVSAIATISVLLIRIYPLLEAIDKLDKAQAFLIH